MQVDTPQKIYRPVKRDTTPVSPAVPVKPVSDEKEHPDQTGGKRKRRTAEVAKDEDGDSHFDGFA